MSMAQDHEIDQLYAARYRQDKRFYYSSDLKDSLENSSAAESLRSNRSKKSKPESPTKGFYQHRLHQLENNEKRNLSPSPSRSNYSNSGVDHSPLPRVKQILPNQKNLSDVFKNLHIDTQQSNSSFENNARASPRKITRHWPPKQLDKPRIENNRYDGRANKSSSPKLTPVESAIRNLLQQESQRQSLFSSGSDDMSKIKNDHRNASPDRISRRQSMLHMRSPNSQSPRISPGMKNSPTFSHEFNRSPNNKGKFNDIVPVHMPASPFLFGDTSQNGSNTPVKRIQSFSYSPKSKQKSSFKELESPAGLLAFVTRENSPNQMPDKIKHYMKQNQSNENSSGTDMRSPYLDHRRNNINNNHQDGIIEKNVKHMNGVRVLPTLRNSEDLIKVLRKKAERSDSESPDLLSKKKFNTPLLDITNESNDSKNTNNSYDIEKGKSSDSPPYDDDNQQNIPPNKKFKESLSRKLGNTVSKSINRSMSVSINRTLSRSWAKTIRRRESFQEDLSGRVKAKYQGLSPISGSSLSTLTRRKIFTQTNKNYQALQNESESKSLLSSSTEPSTDFHIQTRAAKVRASRARNRRYTPDSRSTSLPHPIDASVLSEVSLKDKYPEKFWTFTTSVVLPELNLPSKCINGE